MPYTVNYNPTIDDLYVFPTSPTVWPNYVGAGAIGENPNIPLKNQIAFYDGVGLTYNIDLSGVSDGFYRQLGQAFSCPTCFTQNEFPYCNTFWNSAIMGGQGPGGDSSQFCSIFNGEWESYNTTKNTEPYKSIRPDITDVNDVYVNGKFWNDINLWRTNTFQGNVLIDNEDNDAETYLWTLNHSITTSPCDYYRMFSFWDRTTNTIHSRYFICPCKEWGLPLSGQYQSGLGCNNCCDGIYSFFTSEGGYDINNPPSPLSDGRRLWVMAKNIGPNTQNIPEGPQQPIPSTIKRYKVLLGNVRKNWPIFGVDSNFKFIRAKTQDNFTPSDPSTWPTRGRDIPTWGSITILGGSVTNSPSQIKISGGEGDDGPYPFFTVSHTGETVIVSYTNAEIYFNYIDPNFYSYNQPLTTGVPTPCIDGQVFIKDGDKIKFNTYCAPALFHPELVIPNYPTNDVKILIGMHPRGQLIDAPRLTIINNLLEQLGKPKIKTYVFPESNLPSEVNFPDIYETDKKYPLFQEPHLSRESKNSFFKNTNLISFNEKKMLQASELNEMQEKFYKNQSLFVEYINKWFTKQHIETETDDIFGFSEYSNSSIGATGPNWLSNTGNPWLCSKAIPFEKGKIKLGSGSPDNPQKLRITLSPCKLMLNSVFHESSVLEVEGYGADFTKKYNNIDYINIESDVLGEIDLTQIKETDINAITIRMDINNLISCNEYSELRDNSSSDQNQFSPCGADRNYMSPITPTGSSPNQLVIVQQNIPKTPNQGLFNVIDRYENSTFANSTPFNQIAWPGYMVYLLAFVKKENGALSFYYANGIKIDDI